LRLGDENKERKIEEETTGQKYKVRICYTQGGHKQNNREYTSITSLKGDMQ